MTTPDDTKISNLHLVVGADRMNEFSQSLQPKERATIQAGFDPKTEADPNTSAWAKTSLAKALLSFVRGKGQEIIGAR